MKRLGLTHQRTLPRQGWVWASTAFVCPVYGAGDVGMNRYPSRSQRSFGMLGHEDWLHPGKGSA